jgi:hypothetical protein
LKDFAEKKLAGEFTYFEISALKGFKSLEINKWLQFAHLGVAAVEDLEAGEAPQWAQVAHLGVAAVELLKADEVPKLWREFAELEPG